MEFVEEFQTLYCHVVTFIVIVMLPDMGRLTEQLHTLTQVVFETSMCRVVETNPPFSPIRTLPILLVKTNRP